MGGETISRGDVDSFEVWTPVLVTADAITDCVEELLVPTNRTKKLRRKLVFRFDVISERVCISHARHFKARFIKLGPNLQMTPGETDVLPENIFSVIIDIASGRQRRFCFASKIWALAR